MRHPVKAETRDKQRRAVELRLAGATYNVIAEQLGYAGHTSARHAVQRGLDLAIQEPAEEVLRQELARLDRLLTGLWAKAVRGEYAAVDRALKIMSQRARYLGLETVKMEVTTHDGDLIDLDAELAKMAQRQP